MDMVEKGLLKSTAKGVKSIASIAKTRTAALKHNLNARAVLLNANQAQYGLYVTYLRQVYNSGVMLHAMNAKLNVIFAAAEQRMAIETAGNERAMGSLSDWGQKLARR